MSSDLNSLSHAPCDSHLCVSLPHKGLHSGFIEQPRERHLGEGMGLFAEILNRGYKGLSLWLQVNPTDPDDTHHCTSTNNYKLWAFNFMVDLRKLLFNFHIYYFH